MSMLLGALDRISAWRAKVAGRVVVRPSYIEIGVAWADLNIDVADQVPQLDATLEAFARDVYGVPRASTGEFGKHEIIDNGSVVLAIVLWQAQRLAPAHAGTVSCEHVESYGFGEPSSTREWAGKTVYVVRRSDRDGRSRVAVTPSASDSRFEWKFEFDGDTLAAASPDHSDHWVNEQ